jgi:serine/threonine protein phosphatase PrpC
MTALDSVDTSTASMIDAIPSGHDGEPLFESSASDGVPDPEFFVLPDPNVDDGPDDAQGLFHALGSWQPRDNPSNIGPQLVFAQKRGLLAPGQHDALLVAGEIHQASSLAVRQRAADPLEGICAVSDGVTLGPYPRRASRAVLEALRGIGPQHDDLLQDGWICPRLVRRHLHPALCLALAGDRRTRGAACTLAVLQWRTGRLSVLNVGDSRVYRIDRAGRWEQLSRDHTYLQSMVERGEIAPDPPLARLYRHPEHLLVADEAREDFAIHWWLGDWKSGDTILMCTDGLHDTLGQQVLETLFRAERPLKSQAAVFLDAVLKAGAPDNVSLILGRMATPAQGRR